LHETSSFESELRYIEGLFNLPLGHLGGFYMIPRRGYEKCKCGRTPSALDVVYFALTKHIHHASSFAIP